MKIQSDLNKIIYKSIIFVIAYIPISAHAVYTDCEGITPFYIKDGLCAVFVQNCKEDNKVVSGTATCDTQSVLCPPTSLSNCQPIQCPTNPNECANDNEGDGITNYTNTAPPPIISGEEPYHSCKKEGETTIRNNKCQMRITGCKQGNSNVTVSGIATCDVQGEPHNILCDRSRPPGCRASCPTNPNECANDNEEDNKGNYSNTERIVFTPELYENDFQRRNNRGRPD